MKSSQTNTFTGGMQKDLHPMVTPSNVLTDALNATIITMNGNESVLQNDMGNARIESAYLPSGYVPIGMKEHGGVIYIAAYNPLTKKGQIGSFPSPERNINKTEKSGYKISQDGKSIDLKFNEKDQSWNVESNGKSHKLMKMNANGTASLYLGDRVMNVSLDAQGVTAARNAAMEQTYAMQ